MTSVHNGLVSLEAYQGGRDTEDPLCVVWQQRSADDLSVSMYAILLFVVGGDRECDGLLSGFGPLWETIVTSVYTCSRQ